MPTGPDDLSSNDPLDGKTDLASVANRIERVANIVARALTRFNHITGQVGPGPQQDPGVQTAVNDVIAQCQQLQQAAQTYLDPATGSSVELKKDIHYLTSTDRARIAEEALSLKLATFKYKNADQRERLGFMLEDAPTVVAADMSAKQVDLYAYTSMVLALVQEQQHEIATLKAEVERLKK